ncbi:glycoside hydrolase family 26 protein [Kineococcus rhizosphaerae]|uniref:Beta-mannanase n=1 Tax=Kineococcus rhizosphaerae TaxID=559628 RepID=A0A2T0R4N0_9ACTN|nr:glycosyl hydrolase [Kineococcus rhizosphaerae]PRY15262.1 beta-mannanase [Kineococcus rhizosphaerae]
MKTTKTPRRHRFTSLAAALVTAGSALVATATVNAPAADAATIPVNTKAGVFSTGSRATVTEWGQWVGRDVGVTTAFIPHMTWNDISNWQWGVGLYADRYHRVAWAVPMLPDTAGVSIQQGAAGQYNGYYKSLAQLLVKNNQGDSIIRLGWEFNSDSYKWSAKKDPAAWVAYWRQVVTTMRSVPGANFSFNWSPGSGNNMGQFDSAKAYPGDAYVDIVGQSLYDHSKSFKASQSVERWGNFYNQPGGLKWLAEFGKAHGKPIAFSEWGLTKSCDGLDSGDDTYFIQKFYDYVSNNNVAYESYFNKDVNGCEQHALNTGNFPKAAALYKKLWSAGFVASVAPVTSGTPATDTTLIRTRVDSDVTSAKFDLNGAHLHGANYIDVNVPKKSTRAVYFYLDKAATGTPTKTEWTAPYDFGGMSPISPSALPTDVSSWTPGQHTMTVVVSRYNLPNLVQTATFQVG